MQAEQLRLGQLMHRQVRYSHRARSPLLILSVQAQPGTRPQPHPNDLPARQPVATRVEQKPQPVIIKYPIEDLDVAPKLNGVTRPELKFLTSEMAHYVKAGRKDTLDDLHFESLGMLLEVWNTLNVQCEVYVLDSFTFDDFVDAMKFSSVDLECELLDEVFCAVLKQLVDDQGKAEISLPKIEEEKEEDSEESQEDSEVSTTPADEPPARSTRSNRPSNVNPAEEDSRNSSGPGPAIKLHRAADVLAGFNWQEHLGHREMEDGGWQLILVGLLNQLSYAPHLKGKVDQILAYLTPMEEEPTRTSVHHRFAAMDVNLRASALQLITMLSITTRTVKDFLETCSEDQTDVRKRKIEYQREKRAAMEELTIRDRERKILLPENMPGSPKADSTASLVADVDMDDTLETNGDAGSSDADEEEIGRSLRRHKDRKRKREDEVARLEKGKAEKAAAAKAQSKQSREFQKLVKEVDKLKERIIDLESKILECDADLREANVQRTKVLGKDRFCNRYYWFERNGQPFGGLPSSSTAHYGYANGRIWVQGPDDMEREGFIDITKDLEVEYHARFRMTVRERRRQEEGVTTLQNAQEWGFYDDAERLDSLIAWLDDRGDREKKLKKELLEWQDEIAKYMRARKSFLDEETATKVDADDDQTIRISTRHAIQKNRSAAADRCLRWHNSMAVDQQKHLHSQSPPKARTRKKAGDKGVAQLVLTNRSGKPLTRQGFK